MNTSFLSLSEIKTYIRKIQPTTSKTNIILMLHGWNLAGGTSWLPLLNILSESFPSSYIVAPDLPGMGESTAPDCVWGVEEYTRWAQDLCHAINPDNSSDVILMGHSFGGVIAAQLSLQHDLNIKHLLLLAPAIIREQKPSSPLFLKLKTTIPTWIYQTAQATWRNIIGSDDYKKTNGIMRKVFTKIVTQDTRKSLSHTSIPTTLIWGEKDTYTPPYQAEIIHSLLPHSKLIMLPNINHGIHLHAKEIIAQEIRKLLDGNE
jgi:pimeloyl-ACP methyl ester carboxylesterase